MTKDIFNEWLLKIDKKFRIQNRKILLFIDNLSGHAVTVNLTNVKIQFYPPNCTSIIQPLEQGIIQNFKHFYKTGILKSIINKLDIQEDPDIKIDIKDSIDRICLAWNEVQADTITNCFRP